MKTSLADQVAMLSGGPEVDLARNCGPDGFFRVLESNRAFQHVPI